MRPARTNAGDIMRIAVMLGAIVALLAMPVRAGERDVATTIKTYEAVANDPARLKTFCDMIAYAASSEEVSEERMDAFLDKLGPDFRDAWTSEDLAGGQLQDSDLIDEAIGNLYVACGS